MKKIAFFSLAAGAVIAAEPAPSVSPSAPVATPTLVPTPLPTLQEQVDRLSPADIAKAIEAMKSGYLDPAAFGEVQMNRATLQGLLDRLKPGIELIEGGAQATEKISEFRSEVLDKRIGYVRMGSLLPEHVAKLDSALDSFSTEKIGALILDFRATPGGPMEQAAEILRRFCPKGRVLFTFKKQGDAKDQVFTSNRDPAFTGVIVALTSGDTAGVGEVAAAVLRAEARALIVGGRTAGRAAEYEDFDLSEGRRIRVATGVAVPASGPALFREGVKPDVAVETDARDEEEILRKSLAEGAAAFIAEKERPRLNEASLVAGKNPELDALQAAQRDKGKEKPRELRDLTLQRAVDLVTSISIYQRRKP